MIDHRRTINVLTQEVEKLKLFHKDTVDRLQLELLQAKAVGKNVSQIRVRGDNDTTIVVEDAVNRVLHHTPMVSGGFESPTMASAEARSDQGRGLAHIWVREWGTVLRWHLRRHVVIQSVGQLKTGSGAGMMISPQRGTSG
jgi:hypothetical protein